MAESFANQCDRLELEHTTTPSGGNALDRTWPQGHAVVELLPGEGPLVRADGLRLGSVSLVITTAGRIVCGDNTVIGEARSLDPKYAPMLERLASLLLENGCDPDFDQPYCEKVLLEVVSALAQQSRAD